MIPDSAIRIAVQVHYGRHAISPESKQAAAQWQAMADVLEASGGVFPEDGEVAVVLTREEAEAWLGDRSNKAWAAARAKVCAALEGGRE